MARRHYTEEKIAATRISLVLNGGNVKRTALQHGLSRDTVDRWHRHELPQHVDVRELTRREEATNKRLAAKWEQLTDMSLARALEMVRGASYREVAIGAGIGTEKLQLLRGQPTARIQASYGQLLDEIRERLPQLKVLEGGGKTGTTDS